MNAKVKKRFLFVLAAAVIGFYGYRSMPDDIGIFIASYIKNPAKVGAIIPSSAALAKVITKYAKSKEGKLKILEVGAGTGVFTAEIIEHMKEDSIFDVIEIDKEFADILIKRFGSYKNVNIHNLSILDWNPIYRYNAIISGLPLNSFDEKLASSILEKYQEIIAPGGTLSYFEYIGASIAGQFFFNVNTKDMDCESLTTSQKLIDLFEFENEKVFKNIPPARVHHLRIP